MLLDEGLLSTGASSDSRDHSWAMLEVLLEGFMERQTCWSMTPPRIIGWGRKPLLSPVDRRSNAEQGVLETNS